jgi:hypothetical protein
MSFKNFVFVYLFSDALYGLNLYYEKCAFSYSLVTYLVFL